MAKWYDYDRCDIRISQITIDNALNQFLNDTFINTHLISIYEFNSQINHIIL
ncbi:hypothetical protein I4U23_005669 [Adineta vaga]|nr:hypothetical protein I4U23_005669 [Adineta vaga]